MTLDMCSLEPSDDEDEDEEEDPMAPMITWKDFQRLMPWEIVILVGGGYALAAGCKVAHIGIRCKITSHGFKNEIAVIIFTYHLSGTVGYHQAILKSYIGNS